MGVARVLGSGSGFLDRQRRASRIRHGNRWCHIQQRWAIVAVGSRELAALPRPACMGGA